MVPSNPNVPFNLDLLARQELTVQNPFDIETPRATAEDRQMYMKVFRAAVRHRSGLGRRHFCHDPVYRAAFLRRIIELRRAIRFDNQRSTNATI